MEVPLHLADFWVQVHDLSSGFFAEIVGKALGNYIGSYVAYDEKNVFLVDRPYLRIRVRLDVRQPLKKGNKVRKPESDWVMCNFKYKKLPTFCFICGLIGHIDRQCEMRFRISENEIVRLWDVSLRAPNRRISMLGGERWLLEDRDGVGMGGNGVARKDGHSRAASQSPSGSGTHPRISVPAHLLDLRSNLGANIFDKDKEVKYEKAVVINETVGLEINYERKRRREDEVGTSQRSAMELNNLSGVVLVNKSGGHEPKLMVPAGQELKACPDK